MVVSTHLPHSSFIYAGARLNLYHFNQGEGLPRHEHGFNHAVVCIVGTCVVKKEGKELILTASSEPVDLVRGEWHEIEALIDGTILLTMFVA
jgi:quercetin dioxygenase-like cupin family protein